MTAEEEFEKIWISDNVVINPIFQFEIKPIAKWFYLHQQEKIDRLEEGINAALSYNLPYLVEKALKELLEEPK